MAKLRLQPQQSGRVCASCGNGIAVGAGLQVGPDEYFCDECAGVSSSGSGPAEMSSPAPTLPVSPAAPPVKRQPIDSRLPPGLRSRVTCPHCWHIFSPDQILWVSEHADLKGDSVLGHDASMRFMPTRFTVEGAAIDGRGMQCQTLACPRCHLILPRPVIGTEPMFVSVVGVPSSGKSYFLAAMTWELRRVLPGIFGISFTDADTITNQMLTINEELLFLQPDAEKWTAIEKTELTGSLYDQVQFGEQTMNLPKPLLFAMRPARGHPSVQKSEHVSRVICMYDNAGEHFRPGMDSTSSPMTQHLAKSKAIIFLYDPTKDPRFRDRCKEVSADPQLFGTANVERQEMILTEAAMRVRRYAGLAPGKKHERPLIIVVAKSDVWGHLLNADLTTEPLVANALGELSAVNIARVETVSAQLRKLLLQVTPEFVAAAEDFCQHVVYVPVSVFANPPQRVDGQTQLMIRPKDVKPRWVTVPLLYLFAKWTTGLIGGVSTKPTVAVHTAQNAQHSRGASAPQPAPIGGNGAAK